MRRFGLCLSLAAAGLAAHAPSQAAASVEGWELNELYQDLSETPEHRFVELVNLEGGCLFPSSTLDLYDAQGELLDTQPLVNVTTCFDGPAFFLASTAATDAFFGVARDIALASTLPSDGQMCFSSSATDYDCVRWGAIDSAVTDLFGAGDVSAVPALPSAESLARQQSSHVVADDWGASGPTPRQPNDGTIIEIPDAGPIPDAAPIVDAGPRPDAAQRPDATPGLDAQIDERNTDYLDLDAGGGASCGCQSSGASTSALWSIAVLALLRRRRRS